MIPRLLLCAALVGAVTAQAAQLMHGPIDVSAIVRADPVLATADAFVGACRDNSGSYWTCVRDAGTWYAVRIDANDQVADVVDTGVTTGMARDMSFDRVRSNVWILWNNPPAVRVVQTSTASVVASPQPLAGDGIAFNSYNRVYVEGQSQNYDATTFALSGGLLLAAAPQGVAYLPTNDQFWAGRNNPAEPHGRTVSLMHEHPGGATMPPETSFPTDPANPSGTRGGFLNGMDAWQDPATGEWLGVFCQRLANGDAMAYTARFSEPTGTACPDGGVFTEGPMLVQDKLYARGNDFLVFVWLMVSFEYVGSIPVPALPTGCTAEVDPATLVVLGPFFQPPLPVPQPGISEPVPVDPTIANLPLYCQWLTWDLQSLLSMSEGRSFAIKQW